MGGGKKQFVREGPVGRHQKKIVVLSINDWSQGKQLFFVFQESQSFSSDLFYRSQINNNIAK